jgi:hypothetical protein
MYALSNASIRTVTVITTIADIATETAAWCRTVDEEFVQPAYELFAEYVKTDALGDFSTLLATIIVYTNKLATLFGYGFLNAPVTQESKTIDAVFVEPSTDNIPTEVWAPVVYSLADVFQVETIEAVQPITANYSVAEVAKSASVDLEALKLQAKSLGIKGWNLFKDSSKLQIKINDALQAHK